MLLAFVFFHKRPIAIEFFMNRLICYIIYVYHKEACQHVDGFQNILHIVPYSVSVVIQHVIDISIVAFVLYKLLLLIREPG